MKRDRMISEIVAHCRQDLSDKRLRQLYGFTVALFALDATEGKCLGRPEPLPSYVSLLPADADTARGVSLALGRPVAAAGQAIVVERRMD